MYIYHYCAEWTDENGNNVKMDGIAELRNDIRSMKDYRDLKQKIDVKYADRMTIVNLSLLR